jgi:hypothetical protein
MPNGKAVSVHPFVSLHVSSLKLTNLVLEITSKVAFGSYQSNVTFFNIFQCDVCLMECEVNNLDL